MPDTCHWCAAWSRLPWGSNGYKAGRCARDGATRTAIETCPAFAERPVDWAAWGLSPPAPRAPVTPLTAEASAGAAQLGLGL
jgi:hypothetical protein